MSDPTESPTQARQPRYRRNKVLMALCIFTTVGYLIYRGLYTLNLESAYAATASYVLYIAELWGGISLPGIAQAGACKHLGQHQTLAPPFCSAWLRAQDSGAG